MLHKDTFDFLQTLGENNNRDWFAENKAWYEQAKADFETFVQELIHQVGDFDKSISYLEAKKCVFRIYRDTRFSNDKTPYKTSLGAILRPPRTNLSGYYLHISPQECFVASGHYSLPPDMLKKVRRGIYDDYEGLRMILDDKVFKAVFGDMQKDEDMLTRVPNGFDKNHPAADYMRLKHYYVMKNISSEELMTEGAVDSIATMYKLLQPFNDLMNDLIND